MVTFFMIPLGNDMSIWAKKITRVHRWALLFTLLKSSSHEVTLLVIIHMGHRYLYIFFFFYHSEVSIHRPFCYWFSNNVSSKSPTIQLNHWPQPMSLYRLISRHFPFQAKWTTKCSAQSYVQWENFLHHIPSRMSQKGAIVPSRMPNVMAWWFRQHPIHDGQFRSHGNLVAHG